MLGSKANKLKVRAKIKLGESKDKIKILKEGYHLKNK